MTFEFTILRDRREKKPYEFRHCPATTEDVTLNTGDYTVAELCQHDAASDTYYPQFAVERKSGEDFVQSITHHRARFEREVKRAADWGRPLLVVIEKPRLLFKRQRGFMKYRDVPPKTVFGTVESWERYYNVTFEFCESRKLAAESTFHTLRDALSEHLVS